ncbi:MAG TPA: aliphatic sulfonate ABC transporter substrate-binding protein [Candidatus Cybelea sp.]|nr:aliphatic sulfonate ABC transporter substrate-binding protein [Candidatus Cybelea sp.]
MTKISRRHGLSALAGLVALGLAAALAGNATAAPKQINIDYSYYNPVSLVLKEKGWVEEEFSKDGIGVQWVLTLGSNKAIEFLNAGAIDFGATAGSAALLARANSIPIKAVYIYSRPEWTALVVRADSPIKSVADLKGKRIAVTKGTDPYIFLLRALDKFGVSESDVQEVLLQHPLGKVALEKGEVDAWAGLDPHMAQTELEQHSRLFYRNTDFNTYGFLNTREAFAKENPKLVERVIQVYEKGRKWALANPDDFRAIVAAQTKVSDPVAKLQLERNDLSNPVIGEEHVKAIIAAGQVLQKTGLIEAGVDVPKLAADLIDPQYVRRAVAAK